MDFLLESLNWFKNTMESDTPNAAEVLGVGKLLDVKWKVGMAMSSDSCRNLNSPYVTMAIKVAQPSGAVTDHTFEMTVIQFQNFMQQMKEMASHFDSV